MLFLFIGDRYQAREGARSLVSALRKKRPTAEYLYLSHDTMPSSPEELLHGRGLFEEKCIAFLNELLETEYGAPIQGNVLSYQESPHAFVLFEPSLPEKKAKGFERHGARVQRFKSESVSQGVTESFRCVDSIVARNQSEALLLLHSPSAQPESILTLLGWQLRVLALSELATNATEIGIKEYPFKKAKRVLEGMRPREPLHLLRQFERVTRRARMQGRNDTEALELFILSLL